MRPILERIRTGETLLADGALGTLLLGKSGTVPACGLSRFSQELWQGLPLGSAPESLNLTQPDVLRDIVRAYQAAGADIFQANTFGASPLKLAGHGLAGRTEELNRTAVEIVRSVVGATGHVWASIGPSGKLLKPYGDTEPQTVYDSFACQAGALAGAKPDILAIETMTDLGEALLAVKAAREFAPGIPVLASMTYEKRKKGFFTIMGNSIGQCVQGLAAAGADIVGTNCGNGIEDMILVARELRVATKLPISIRPNAGLPQVEEENVIYPETPEFMAQRLPQLLNIGISIIGGCCGTTPDHIRAFRAVLDGRQ